jgi:hypothetical protein
MLQQYQIKIISAGVSVDIHKKYPGNPDLIITQRTQATKCILTLLIKHEACISVTAST